MIKNLVKTETFEYKGKFLGPTKYKVMNKKSFHMAIENLIWSFEQYKENFPISSFINSRRINKNLRILDNISYEVDYLDKLHKIEQERIKNGHECNDYFPIMMNERYEMFIDLFNRVYRECLHIVSRTKPNKSKTYKQQNEKEI